MVEKHPTFQRLRLAHDLHSVRVHPGRSADRFANRWSKLQRSKPHVVCSRFRTGPHSCKSCNPVKKLCIVCECKTLSDSQKTFSFLLRFCFSLSTPRSRKQIDQQSNTSRFCRCASTKRQAAFSLKDSK